jgi:hypothetical protein
MCTIYAFLEQYIYILVGLRRYCRMLFCYLFIHIENFTKNVSSDLGNWERSWIRKYCEIFLVFTGNGEGNAFFSPFSFKCFDIKSRNVLYLDIETVLLKHGISYQSRKASFLIVGLKTSSLPPLHYNIKTKFSSVTRLLFTIGSDSFWLLVAVVKDS